MTTVYICDTNFFFVSYLINGISFRAPDCFAVCGLAIDSSFQAQNRCETRRGLHDNGGHCSYRWKVPSMPWND